VHLGVRAYGPAQYARQLKNYKLKKILERMADNEDNQDVENDDYISDGSQDDSDSQGYLSDMFDLDENTNNLPPVDIKSNDLLAQMLQMEEDEKLAAQLMEEEKKLADQAEHVNKMNPAVNQRVWRNLALNNNPKKEITFCLGKTAQGYACCNHPVHGLFCCSQHQTNWTVENYNLTKKTIMLVLIRYMPDKNIRNSIYKLITSANVWPLCSLLIPARHLAPLAAFGLHSAPEK